MLARTGLKDQISGLSIEDLIELNSEITRLIHGRLQPEKVAAKAKLDAIQNFERELLRVATSSKSALEPHVTNRAGSKANPKYVNPQTGETWAGRGMQPRWMRQEIESGRSPEDFLIVKTLQPAD